MTLFGESHGPMIGAVLDGMAPGIPVSEEHIRTMLTLRRPCGEISTGRVEPDAFQIVSGVRNGRTTGTPVCILIPNTQADSTAYPAEGESFPARPGHADYTGFMKYHGFEDRRGGGHFSGRITAALTAAGAIALDALAGRGIRIGTHILACAGIRDRAVGDLEQDIKALSEQTFAVLDEERGCRMREEIARAASGGDSVGGILETAVTGFPAGIGEPWFDTLEGVLSHALFSIPAVKGVEFGAGFSFAQMRGSEAGDAFILRSGASESGSAVSVPETSSADGTGRGLQLQTKTNHNGGINGGISSGMPLIFRCAVKPTPSIFLAQDTVDLVTGKQVKLALRGRHDPAIVHRARIVADAVTALVLCDMLAQRFGTDYLAPESAEGRPDRRKVR